MGNKNVVQKVVLGGVVFHKEKVLIVQRNQDEEIFPDMWELPSGKKEDFETAEFSLIREVKEETNLDVKPIIAFDVFNYQIEKSDFIKDSTQINYIVQPTVYSEELVVVLSSEHQAFQWIDINEINNFNLSESTKKTIEKAFKLLKFIHNEQFV